MNFYRAQLRALGGLVSIGGGTPGTKRAQDAPKYGAEGMPHGTVDSPLVFLAVGEDGVVTIVVPSFGNGAGGAHRHAADRRR